MLGWTRVPPLRERLTITLQIHSYWDAIEPILCPLWFHVGLMVGLSQGRAGMAILPVSWHSYVTPPSLSSTPHWLIAFQSQHLTEMCGPHIHPHSWASWSSFIRPPLVLSSHSTANHFIHSFIHPLKNASWTLTSVQNQDSFSESQKQTSYGFVSSSSQPDSTVGYK